MLHFKSFFFPIFFLISLGINISSHKPKMLTLEMINRANMVVTMGCSVEEVCPRPMLDQMQKKLVDWNLRDPKGRPIEEVREIRDDIEKRIRKLKIEYTFQNRLRKTRTSKNKWV